MAEDEKDDDDIDEGEKGPSIYPITKIKITRDQYSVSELKKQIETRKNIVMQPDFQRNYTWDAKQQCELIESIIMGIPLPVIYLFEGNDGKKQVVDGRQRLTTMLRYMNDEFALSGLKVLIGENGKKFSKLDPLLQGKIEDCQIQIYIIQPPTPEQLKYDIFDRVNRGGTILTEQEMRNALHQGKSTELLIKLAKSKYFKQATGNSISTKKMKDCYIILRFLSFYMLWKKWFNDIEYKSNIDDFLAKSMDFMNKLPEEKIHELENIFDTSMKLNFEISGSDGFRMGTQADGRKRKPINMALFEALAYLFSESDMNLEDKKRIKNKVDLLKEEFERENFSQQVDSSTKVIYRFRKVTDLQKEFKND
jgi:hypothetical protein